MTHIFLVVGRNRKGWGQWHQFTPVYRVQLPIFAVTVSLNHAAHVYHFNCSRGINLAATWAGVAVFDSTIFLLTLYKVFSRARPNGASFLTLLLRDGKDLSGLVSSTYSGTHPRIRLLWVRGSIACSRLTGLLLSQRQRDGHLKSIQHFNICCESPRILGFVDQFLSVGRCMSCLPLHSMLLTIWCQPFTRGIATTFTNM